MKQNSLLPKSWYHGTEAKFANWQIPAPEKDKFTVRHHGVFLTTNRKYALGAGPNIARCSLNPNANVLDCTVRSDQLEQLRAIAAEHFTRKYFLNFEPQIWNAGWISGDVLRPLANEDGVRYLQSLAHQYAEDMNCHWEVAWLAIQLNATRGLIEHICRSAIKMGLDGIYGNEVDRHSESPKVLAQPWLAIFKVNAVTAPVWE